MYMIENEATGEHVQFVTMDKVVEYITTEFSEGRLEHEYDIKLYSIKELDFSVTRSFEVFVDV